MKLVIKRYLTSAFILGSALVMASCVMDTFDDDISSRGEYNGQKLPKGKYFVTFNITETDDNTRALPDSVQFEDGVHDEHDIGGIGSFIIYLNANDQVVNVDELFGEHEEHPHDYIEGHYVSTFDVEEDYQTPDKCIVILNALKYREELNNCVGKNKSDILNMEWIQHYGTDGIETDTVGRNDNGRFLMSNSIHYGEDPKSGNIVLLDAQPLPLEVIQDATENENNPDKVVTVKVERMVAKATLSYKDKDGKIIPLTKDHIFGPDIEFVNLFTGFDNKDMHEYKVVKYRVRCTGWGMNALEKSGSLFKNIGSGASANDEWSDQRAYRYHWAVDKHYYDNETGTKENLSYPYPWQFRDAYNLPQVDHYSVMYTDNKATDNNVLKNYSYDDFVRMNYFTKEIYIPENTFDYARLYDELDQRPEVLAGTHFIMTAILETAFDAPSPDLGAEELEPYFAVDSPEKRTVYRDRIGNIYRTPQDAFKALIVSFNYGIQSQFDMKFPLYKWDDYDDPEPYGVTKKHEPEDNNWVAATGINYALYYFKGGDENNTSNYIEITVPNVQDENNFNIMYKTLKEAKIKHGDGQRIILDPNFRVLNKAEFAKGNITPVYIYDVDYWKDIEDYNRNLPTGYNPITPSIDHIFGSTVSGHVIAKDAGKNGKVGRTATINDIESLMFNWIGPIDHFNEGRMYYYHPISHEKNKYGIVRNNWYRIVLNGIHNLGTSVDNPSDPIVPNFVGAFDQAIDIQAYLLKWHVVEGDVKILP